MEFTRKLKPKNIYYMKNRDKDKKIISKLWHKRINYIAIKNILIKIGFVSISRSIIDIRPPIFIGRAKR
jgi:hypothetical protein